MYLHLLCTILICTFAFSAAFAQGISACKNFVAGKIIDLPTPNFSLEAKKARAAGKVEIRVKINEKGEVVFADVVSGNSLLLDASMEAAKRAKYLPQTCDDKPMMTDGIIVYNFVLPTPEKYFSAKSIDEFTDVSRESESFEAIFYLTENAKISFGTADKKFEPEKNLTRGEFAEFLLKTIEYIEERSKLVKPAKQRSRIFKTFNPRQLKTASEIRDFDELRPFAVSTQTLLEKYQIVFVNESNNFNGNFPMSQNEVTTFWKEIFGEEALPVNFSADKLRVITRGEFAIFLAESLEVLTYKLLPE